MKALAEGSLPAISRSIRRRQAVEAKRENSVRLHRQKAGIVGRWSRQPVHRDQGMRQRHCKDRKDSKNGAKSLTITTVNGKQKPVEGRLFNVAWNNENALVLMINTHTVSDESAKTAETRCAGSSRKTSELRAVLDTATDGVLVLDRAGRVLSANRSAGAVRLRRADFAHLTFGDLFAPESRRAVLDYLDRIAGGAAAGILEAGREAIGRVRRGGLVPLYLTLGRIEDGEKVCAVLRDVTAWKRTEEELINARQQAERASTAKSGIPRQDQPRDPHAAQRHHRLLRSNDGRALRPGRQRALPAISQGHPHLRRPSDLAAQRPARSVEDRSRQSSSSLS